MEFAQPVLSYDLDCSGV